MTPLAFWNAAVAAVRFVIDVMVETQELRRKLGRTHYGFEN